MFAAHNIERLCEKMNNKCKELTKYLIGRRAGR